jgi:diacylglycerol O-acyltransferase-1
MSTLTDTATSTATAMSPSSHHSARPMSNGNTPEPVANRSAKMRDAKYRHVFATHSQPRMSNLTHGADTPSFVGFRNLMVLVLGRHAAVAAGLRLSNNHSRLKTTLYD